jgi:hypothetical protein
MFFLSSSLTGVGLIRHNYGNVAVREIENNGGWYPTIEININKG